MPSSGSPDALPSSMKSSPSSTDAGHETRAAGAAFCHSTLTICSDEDCSEPSETVSLNLSDVPSGYGANGAVKVAVAALALLNTTAVPSICTQEKVKVLPSGSLEPLPFSVTVSPVKIDAGDTVVAATGGWLGLTTLRTVIVVSAGADVIAGLQPVTRSVNIKVAPAGPTAGAVNIGLAAVALLSATLGPEVWLQA